MRVERIKRQDQGATCLFKILISESAYPVCKRTVRRQESMEREVKAIRLRVINRKIPEDKTTSDHENVT